MLIASNEFKWNKVFPTKMTSCRSYKCSRFIWIALGCKLLYAQLAQLVLIYPPMCNMYDVRITHSPVSYSICMWVQFNRPGNPVVAPTYPKCTKKISCWALMTAFYAYTCIPHSQSIIRFLQQLKPQFITWFRALGVHTHNGCVYHPHWKIDHLAKMGLHCLIKFWPRNKNYPPSNNNCK